VDVFLLQNPGSLLGARRFDDSKLAAEEVVDRVADGGLIVDDEYAVLAFVLDVHAGLPSIGESAWLRSNGALFRNMAQTLHSRFETDD
jgi:hypothetical protein